MNNLLFQLRDAVLDENESTAGLLRKCIMLGADTGSEKLKRWALLELKGYSNNDDLPAYRSICVPILSVDSISGQFHVTDQTITRLQIPENARKFVPEFLNFNQPLEELEGLAKQDSTRFANPSLHLAANIWNRELPLGQQITDLRYIFSDAVFQGIIGKIRTSLVELIAELTAVSPLKELPQNDSIDKILEIIIKPAQQNITNNITGSNNQIAIGNGNSQYNINQELDRIKDDISKIRSQAAEFFDAEEDIEELNSLVKEVDSALASPDTINEEQRQSFMQRFYAFASRTSNTTFQALLSGAAQGIATLGAQGFFT